MSSQICPIIDSSWITTQNNPSAVQSINLEQNPLIFNYNPLSANFTLANTPGNVPNFKTNDTIYISSVEFNTFANIYYNWATNDYFQLVGLPLGLIYAFNSTTGAIGFVDVNLGAIPSNLERLTVTASLAEIITAINLNLTSQGVNDLVFSSTGSKNSSATETYELTFTNQLFERFSGTSSVGPLESITMLPNTDILLLVEDENPVMVFEFDGKINYIPSGNTDNIIPTNYYKKMTTINPIVNLYLVDRNSTKIYNYTAFGYQNPFPIPMSILVNYQTLTKV